jgi:acyl phosphate:glycerol-3-phosphate acyltransferase
MEFITFGILAYLLGSIPTAVWIGKVYHGIDIREHGSKNAGATNTFRVLGKKSGIIVLFVDILKGALSVLIPYFFLLNKISESQNIDVQILAAIFAIVGHVFPVFANFKGGKGVATSLGVIIGIQPLAAGLCLLIFILVFIMTQYVSLGAISAAVLFPILVVFIFKFESYWLNIFSVVLSLTVIVAHKKNINRLVKGTENKMNLFKK